MCNYNFEIPVDPIPLMEMVKKLILENGGAVTGEVPNLAVTIPTPVGVVAGKCKLVEGRVVNLHVTKKPEFMTCNMVRSKLVYYITEAVRLYSTLQPAAAD